MCGAGGGGGRGGRGRSGGGRDGGRGGGKGDGDLGTDIYKILRLVKDKHFEPVIVFSFSRKCALPSCALPVPPV